MQLATNTTEGWSAVMADFAAKRQTTREHTERLRTEKQRLALEAAMGSPDAKKRLKEINAEMTRLALEADDWDAAIAQAEIAKGQAERAEAEATERQRQEELSKLASTAIAHAAEFTAALRQGVKAGAALKLVVADMLRRATPAERPNLDRILQPGPFMRAAEFAGLRDHLEFRGYTGPRDHVVALEEELSVNLERWLTQPEKKEATNGK